MAKVFTRRERVLTAIHHAEPNRVPTALWGSYYTLQDQTYFHLLSFLDLGDPIPPFRRLHGHNSNYYDDRILDCLETDIRYVWLGFTDLGGPHPETGLDAWGVRWQRIGPYITPVEHPLANATLEELDSFPFPDVERFIRVDELRERAHRLHKDAQHAIAARAVNSYGPFEQAQAMRGREQFLIDLIEAPEFASLLIQKITGTLKRLTEIYLDVAGREIDIIEIPGDDYGGANNLLISPLAFAEHIKPALAELVRLVKSYRSDLVVAFHSDGAIVPLLNDFIDIGIDVFHPLEPLPANDHDAIKAQYGDRLTFMGAIDIKTAMPGTTRDVEDEVRRRIHKLAHGGGYILAPANHLGAVKPENIVTLYSAARQFGRYPLG